MRLAAFFGLGFFAGLRAVVRCLAVGRFAGKVVSLASAPVGAEPARIFPYGAGNRRYAGMRVLVSAPGDGTNGPHMPVLRAVLPFSGSAKYSR